MNQILVTEKIYVTPELRRKKKIYKFLFVLSIFLIICLGSVYIYAEYDRNKDENISGDILSFITGQSDTTVISSYDNALVVKITEEAIEEAEILDETIVEEQENKLLQMATATSTYVAPNGKVYESIGVIRISKIDLNYPILLDTTEELMKVAPSKFHGCNPNEVGNLCITAHNYRRKGVFFSDLDTLAIGDIVEIQDLSQRTIQYEVYDIHTVLPNNREDTTQKTQGRKEVSLFTCTDDNSQRLVVRCKEKI